MMNASCALLVAVSVGLLACSGSTDGPVAPASPDADTGTRDASPETSADTGMSDSAAPDSVAPDTTTLDSGDASPGGDADADTGAPPTLLTVPFVIAPPGDGTTFDTTNGTWVGVNASLKAGQYVVGSRTLPASPAWASWSAKLNFAGGPFTCSDVFAQLWLQWNCVGTTCAGARLTTIKIPSASATYSTTISGSLTPTPIAMPGKTAPIVQLEIDFVGDCGTLRIAPSSVTFSSGP